jgi:hypothetical protein
MTPSVRTFARAALWALPVWAALLFVGTLTHQPDTRTDFPGFAAYVTTISFLISHLIASILGAAIGSIGVIALVLLLQDSRAARKAIVGMLCLVTGNTITAAIFGVAAFAQPAMGRMFLAGQQNAPEFYNQVYGVPLFGTVIVGLLLFIMGGISTGAAVATSGRFPRWAGWMFAITAPLFVISNFLLPVAQTPMSALLFVSSVVVAWTAGRAAIAPEVRTSVLPGA